MKGQSSSTTDAERVPLRRVLPWAIVAVALAVGVYLYFRYQRHLDPIIG